jgi:hypothetical protein
MLQSITTNNMAEDYYCCLLQTGLMFILLGGTTGCRTFNINKFARMVICGAISVYNETSLPKSISVQPFLVKNSALMQGLSSAIIFTSNSEAIKHLEHGYRKETDLHRNSGRRF